VVSSACIFKRNEGRNMRNDLPEQAPVLSFYSRPVPNSHQLIDNMNCLKSTVDVYNSYNNEKTRLNFGIFYTVIKNRWSNISSQWNSDKLFHIMGHFAAARQNYITVNATEIDYEDISKPSNISTDLSNSTSSNPQYNVINRFYDSLTSNQSVPTSVTSNVDSNRSNRNFTSPLIDSPKNLSNNIPFETTSHFSTSVQKIDSDSITPNVTTSSTSLQVPNPYDNTHSQYYQPIKSTDSTFLPYPQFPYSNPTHNTSSITSQTLQSTSSSTEKTNTIVIENVSPQQAKNSLSKKRKNSKSLKGKSIEKPLKKIRTRSDTKINQDSGIMGLALTALSTNNLETNESDNTEDDMEITNDK
jgi:hypothetical protein